LTSSSTSISKYDGFSSSRIPWHAFGKIKGFFSLQIILYSIIYVETEYGIHGDAGMLILFYTTFRRWLFMLYLSLSRPLRRILSVTLNELLHVLSSVPVIMSTVVLQHVCGGCFICLLLHWLTNATYTTSAVVSSFSITMV
jgi:hypothetical protein